jgi:hypothetical protein
VPTVPPRIKRAASKFIGAVHALAEQPPNGIPPGFTVKSVERLRKLSGSLGAGESVSIEPNPAVLETVPTARFDLGFSEQVRGAIDRARRAEPPQPNLRRFRLYGIVDVVDVPAHSASLQVHRNATLKVSFMPTQEIAFTQALRNRDNTILYIEGTATIDRRGVPQTLGDVTNAVALKRDLIDIWDEPCEAMFEHLATEEPGELARIAVEGGLKVADLTFAAEQLGNATGELATQALLALLEHKSSVVREGAVYGAQRHIGHPGIRTALVRLSTDDPSPSVKAIAAAALAAHEEP